MPARACIGLAVTVTPTRSRDSGCHGHRPSRIRLGWRRVRAGPGDGPQGCHRTRNFKPSSIESSSVRVQVPRPARAAASGLRPGRSGDTLVECWGPEAKPLLAASGFWPGAHIPSQICESTISSSLRPGARLSGPTHG